MDSATQDVNPRLFHSVTCRNGLIDRYFYLFASLLIAAIVVQGFSHTVDQNLFHASPLRALPL
jgi:hypothetical protein